MTEVKPTKINQLKIGPYDVFAIPTGLFGLDGGSMFGTVPKVLWQKTNPADEQNRIQMEARALLLKSKDRIILIDTGNGSDFIAKYGDKLGARFKEMYNIHDEGPSLIKSLQAAGVTVDEVTDVILTHLHFDHAGGATCERGGKIVATFPKAKYYIQSENLKTAEAPNVREKASYLAANYLPLLESKQLVLINGPQKELLPQISVVVSNGHTLGHQVVIIEDDSTKLIYCGDVIPTSSHVRSAWVMGYDLSPLQIIEEKKSILKLSENKKTYYYFEHDPYCDLATVIFENGDYKVQERFIL